MGSSHESRAALKREHAVRNGRTRGAWLEACSAPQPVPAAGDTSLPLLVDASALPAHARIAAFREVAALSPPSRSPLLSRSAPGALSALVEDVPLTGSPPRTVHRVQPVTAAAAPTGRASNTKSNPAPRAPARRTQGWLPTIVSISEASSSSACDEAALTTAGHRSNFAMPPAPQVVA